MRVAGRKRVGVSDGLAGVLVNACIGWKDLGNGCREGAGAMAALVLLCACIFYSI